MNSIKWISLFWLIFAKLSAQNGPLELFNNVLEKLKSEYTEKAYLHTDKPFYNTDETIWYKSYLVNAINHKASQKSNVLYVDLINSKDSIVFDTKLFITNNEIGAAGDIKIPKEWDSGNYQLRAYTNYMRNEDEAYIFRKSIYIQQSNPKTKSAVIDVNSVPRFKNLTEKAKLSLMNLEGVDINFYPEGGAILEGENNALGIKVLDKSGNGIKVKGAIREKSSQKIVTYFRTFDFGLGRVDLKYEKGKEYEAIIEDAKSKKVVDLPLSKQLVKKLSLVKTLKDITLNVVSDQSTFNHFVVGHQRGNVIFSKTIGADGLKQGVKLVTNDMPSGVVHFTLFDPAGKPLSERLVFVENKSQLKFNLNSESLGKRSRVEYGFEYLGEEFDLADASVSVTSKETIPLGQGDNIKSWLLLNSDLRGEIPNAAAFFDPSKSEYQRSYLLDALMLTHGWRRFNWDSLLADSYKQQEKITPEKGVNISGQIFAKNKEFSNRKIEANLFFLGNSSQIEVKTISQKEKFHFGPFNVKDTLETLLVGKLLEVKKNEEKNIVLLFDKGLPRPKIVKISEYQTLEGNPFLERYQKKKAFFDDIDFTFNGENLLSETLLTVKKKTTNDVYNEILKNSPASYSFPTHRLVLDSLPGVGGQTAIDMLRRIAGVRVNGSFPNYQVSIRGGDSASSGFSAEPDQSSQGNPFSNSGPLFLLDGAISDINFVNNIQASDVSFIDVLSGGDAAVYGGLGGDGVIAIYLKRGSSGNIVSTDVDIKGVANILMTPFYNAKEFFDVDYLKSKGDLLKPDYRSVIHWNPNWKIAKSKDNTQAFYTSDETGVFQISVEGITSKGEIIQVVKEFEVFD